MIDRTWTVTVSPSLQDAIDLFLGNYLVDRWEGVTVPSPLRIERTWRFKLVTSLEAVVG